MVQMDHVVVKPLDTKIAGTLAKGHSSCLNRRITVKLKQSINLGI